MARTIGYDTLDALIDDTVPAAIRRQQPMDLPAAQTEQAVIARLRALASQNVVNKSYIGTGYTDTFTPAVIQRNVLENPGWYTAYTPYQPEISQGRLEALLSFQQMIIDLTGMDLANASMLDESTAAAEAMTLLHRVNKKNRSNIFLVAEDCHPQTIAVVKTRADALGIEVVVGCPDELVGDTEAFGATAAVPRHLRSPGRHLTHHRARPRRQDPGDRGRRYHVPAGGEVTGRTGRRRRGWQYAALRRAHGLWRPPRCVLRHPRRLQALHPRAHHRRFHRPSRQPGTAHGHADPRAAYSPRKGHQQHLYRPGPAGNHGDLLCHVPRS